MALLTPLTPTVAGNLLGAVAAAGGGDRFSNTGKEYFYIKNGGGGAIDVTFDSPAVCSFGVGPVAAHDAVVNVAAGAEKLIGPFPTTRFSDGSGLVQVTYTGVTTVTVAVIRPGL